MDERDMGRCGGGQDDRAELEGGPFAPDSVTWLVHLDPLVGVAALRTLLVQVINPVTSAAMLEHPAAHPDPWRRLSAMVETVALMTFGSMTEAMTAASRTRARNTLATGVTRDGVVYDADRPDHLVWLHCCRVESFLIVTQHGGLALSGAQQDAYIAEQVRIGALFGAEPESLPTSRRELTRAMTRLRPRRPARSAAVHAAWEVLHDDPVAAAGQPLPAWAPMAGLAFASLPRWARALYAAADPDLADPPGMAGLAAEQTRTGLHTLRARLNGWSLDHSPSPVMPDGEVVSFEATHRREGSTLRIVRPAPDRPPA